MLEPPELKIKDIFRCLKEKYSIVAKSIQFLPIGNDPNSWLFKATTQQNNKYFLKVKKGDLDKSVLLVPQYLNKLGIEEVLIPSETIGHQLSEKIAGFSLIVFPFIKGSDGKKLKLTNKQWSDFGITLKKIHSTQLPLVITKNLPKENFIPRWANAVRELENLIVKKEFSEATEKDLVRFWKSKSPEIKKILNRAEELGQLLQAQSLDLVLCHTDIHPANIMLSQTGEMFLVDWDTPLLAPKERDLMFVVHDQNAPLFFTSYGKVEVNKMAIAYYRYEWVVQELATYGQRMLMSTFSQKTKQEAAAAFFALFEPGNVIDAAYESDISFE